MTTLGSWLAGGGVKGGYAHGKSDEIGERVAERPATIQNGNATIAQAVSIDLQHIEHPPSGRPFTVADRGKPVVEPLAGYLKSDLSLWAGKLNLP